VTATSAVDRHTDFRAEALDAKPRKRGTFTRLRDQCPAVSITAGRAMDTYPRSHAPEACFDAQCLRPKIARDRRLACAGENDGVLDQRKCS
jgi:hypothetical protein